MRRALIAGATGAIGKAIALAIAQQPLYRVVLWPHRSLSGRGFGWVMGFTGAMLSLPLVPLAGTAVNVTTVFLVYTPPGGFSVTAPPIVGLTTTVRL